MENTWQEQNNNDHAVLTEPSRIINPVTSQYNISQIMGALYGDGITAHKGAFRREWAAQLHEDVMQLYQEALQRPGGAVGRGPKRHYVEIHPEDIRGFIELATHPWVT